MRSRRRSTGWSRRARTCRRSFVVGAPLRREGRLYNCAVVDPSRPAARRRAEDVSAELPRVLRAAAFHLRRGRARRHDRGRRARGAVRHRPDLRRRRPAGFTFHVEICEDLWVPQPPSARAALRRRRDPAEPVGQQHRDRQGARCGACCARRNRRAASRPMPIRPPGSAKSTTDLAWDGQAGIFEIGERSGRDGALQRPARASRCADIDVGRIRQERMRTNTFGDNARQLIGRRRRRFAASHSSSPRPPAARPAGARSSASRSCRPTRRCSRENCYEAYNIQVQGLAQRLARDRPQAAGDRRLGRPRFDAGADRLRRAPWIGSACRAPTSSAYTLPGFATSSGTKANAWRLMRALGVTGAEIDIRPAASQMLADIGHASAAASRSTT